MKNPTYLLLSRHGIYYFRFPIPVALHPDNKKTYIKLSLETRCSREALYISRLMATLALVFFNNLQAYSMNYTEIRALVQNHFKENLDNIKAKIQVSGQLSLEARGRYERSAETAVDALKYNSFELAGCDGEIDKFLAASSVFVKQGSDEYRTLRQEYVKGIIGYCESVLEYNSRYDNFNFTTAPHQTQAVTVPQLSKVRTLSGCIEEYVSEKKRLGEWGQQSARGFLSQLKLLNEYLGEGAEVVISQSSANDVKGMLQKIPKRCRELKKYKDMGLMELLDLNHNDGMSALSIKKYLGTYSSFYDWAVLRGDVEKNFFKHIKNIKVNQTGEERCAFSLDQVRLIQEEVIQNRLGLIRKPYQKWGALLAMYTGARLNEIAQLDLSDIVELDGVWCFDINANGVNKRLKNAASSRIIPIHSKLIELGLLHYVEECKASSYKRLFHDLTYDKNNGYGRNLGRWFGCRLLVELGIKETSLVFHSFRHTVTDRLFKADVEQPIVQSILGHALVGVTQQVYGKGYSTAQLQTAIEKVSY